ncbi:RING finger and WD repeat domain-containing protein 2 [Boothiomyces sp. JEL0866]|nr:RING finger and WD repeat domain-containing protein 2 [Boothiomyces sp. JEL0866]
MKQVYMTKCGHNFCYDCISTHQQQRNQCPVCNVEIEGIFPNFSLDRLIQRTVTQTSSFSINELDTAAMETIMEAIKNKRKAAELDEKLLESLLLQNFLEQTKNEKIKLLEKLKTEINYISNDLNAVQSAIDCQLPKTVNLPAQVPEPGEVDSTSRKRVHLDVEISHIEPELVEKSSPYISPNLQRAQRSYNSRIHSHIKDLQDNYFAWRHKANIDETDGSLGPIEEFSSTLINCSKYSTFNTLATVKYVDSYFNYALSIVSSIEFDKDDEYFATAGVTKKIKIFNYDTVVSDFGGISSRFISRRSRNLVENDSLSDKDNSRLRIPRYPEREIPCESKISCLSWNTYLKSTIASSDYEGVVSLWDVSVGKKTLNLVEHEKRTWTVDFCELNPTMFASGGDDAKVKLWSTTQKNSTGTIESKANICSVKYHPCNGEQLVFGSADHHLHYYDLRNTKSPLYIFKGHKKAVSYVKFINSDEIVSASTDCSLRLWSLKEPLHSPTTTNHDISSLRTYSGHVNEKNFVGLSVNSDGKYISCGSETNQVYAYYSQLSNPIATHRFGATFDSITGAEGLEDDSNNFISSVCWKRKTPNVLVSANSQGTVKVLEMV